MDGICSAVLNKIFALGSPGRNIVISEDEFFDAFPDGCPRTDAELKKALKCLSAGGYIDIKYSGGDMYCVTPIKNCAPEEAPAPVYAPPVFEAETSVQPPKTPFLPAFFAALAGSALGSAIVSLIFHFL